jgi:hypothetical protein
MHFLIIIMDVYKLLNSCYLEKNWTEATLRENRQATDVQEKQYGYCCLAHPAGCTLRCYSLLIIRPPMIVLETWTVAAAAGNPVQLAGRYVGLNRDMSGGASAWEARGPRIDLRRYPASPLGVRWQDGLRDY